MNMKDRTKANRRRLLILTMIVLLLIPCLTGCFGKDEPDPTDPSDPPIVETAPPTDAPTEPEDVTEAPTEPPVEKESVFATVKVEKLNVRDNPSLDSNVVETLLKGTVVEILEQRTIGESTWGLTAIGWINVGYTDLSTDAEGGIDQTNATGTITAETLNIRDGYGTDSEILGKYRKGDRVTILETYLNLWGRTDKGWISLKYVDLDEPITGKEEEEEKKPEILSDGNTKALGYAVITTGSLNVRCGPGSSYEAIEEATRGERYAYYQKDGNWIRIEDGWVCAKGYAYLEGDKGEGACSGTITGDQLNVRKGPSTKYDSIAKLNKGDKVQILEQIKLGDYTWGYTGEGWISMAYVEVTK